MTTLRPYPVYKSASVDWFGEIPASWIDLKLGRIVDRNDSGAWGEDGSNDDIEVLRSTEQTVDGGWKIVAPARRALTSRDYAKTRLFAGDIVVTTSSGSALHIGKASLVTESMECHGYSFSNFMQRLRPSEGLSSRFLWYLMNNPVMRDQMVFLSTTTTGLANLNGGILNSLSLTLPPLDEQRAIADFLDVADARITRYIAAKRRMIALLEEQKQAIINQAVTHGLDPDVPLKPSGVDWLGDIPTHWEVRAIKHELANLNPRRVPLSSTERGQMNQRSYAYYGASGPIDLVEDFLFDDDLLLIAEDGANLVMRNLPLAVIARGKFWVNNHAHILKPKRGSLEYFAHLLETIDYLPWISGAAQPKLTRDRLMSIQIPVPPTLEQETIVGEIEKLTSGLHNVMIHSRREVELIKEYRTRLISDVVTGKLDVRGVELPALEDVIDAYLMAAEVAESTVTHGGVAIR